MCEHCSVHAAPVEIAMPAEVYLRLISNQFIFIDVFDEFMRVVDRDGVLPMLDSALGLGAGLCDGLPRPRVTRLADEHGLHVLMHQFDAPFGATIITVQRSTLREVVDFALPGTREVMTAYERRVKPFLKPI